MKTKVILTNEASKNHVWKRCHTLCAGPLASFFRQAVMLAHVYDVANVYDDANSKWAANWWNDALKTLQRLFHPLPAEVWSMLKSSATLIVSAPCQDVVDA